MERKFSILCSLLSQPAGHFCLPPSPPPPPPLPYCNLHYFTKWGTVSLALVAYENQAMLFCFAAALHGSSHSTGIPAERTYDVCCRRCMCTRYVLICRYSQTAKQSVFLRIQVRHALPISLLILRKKPTVLQSTVQYTMQYKRPYSKLNRCYFFGFPGKRIAKRAWSAKYLPPSGMHVWLFSLALPFPVRLPKKREKITPILWDRFIYLFYLFTSFSGHRPVQRECARKGLIGPMQSAIPTQSHNP